MNKQLARSMYELESVSRWAVTGTPIQNGLSDLAGLLKFTRAFPYDDPKNFDKDISHLWKSGQDEEAVKRLKRLSRCLILRRAKHTVQLPSRRDLLRLVEFSRAERTLYDNIRNQTITKIEDALGHDTELSRPGSYFLQQIQSMRMICNLGLRYTAPHDRAKSREKSNWVDNAQETFNIRREMETINCSQCSSSMDVTENLGDEIAPPDSAHFFACLKYACSECSYKNRLHNQKLVCGHIPTCPIAPVSISSNMVEEVSNDTPEGSRLAHSHYGFPSKVQALISDLKEQPEDVKWCVLPPTLLTVSQLTYLASSSLVGERLWTLWRRR